MECSRTASHRLLCIDETYRGARAQVEKEVFLILRTSVPIPGVADNFHWELDTSYRTPLLEIRTNIYNLYEEMIERGHRDYRFQLQ